MQIVLKAGAFQNLEWNELEAIDGGIDWNTVGLAVTGGAWLAIATHACKGAKIGAIAGPTGVLVGGFVGIAVGAIIYTLWD